MVNDRLTARQANSLAYIGQLLVNSLPHVLEEKDEREIARKNAEVKRAWEARRQASVAKYKPPPAAP